MAKSKTYIYLEGKEELGDIVYLICENKNDEIVLVVPPNFKVLKNLRNLELLRKEINACKKRVYFDSEDDEFLSLCESSGLEIFLKDYEEEKRVFDIRPPQRKEEKREVKVTFKEEDKKAPSQKTFSFKPSFNFSFLKLIKKIFILVILFFVSYLFLNFVLGFLQTKAKLTVVLDKKEIILEEVVTINENSALPDYENKILPGQKVKIEKNLTESIEPTGREVSEFLPNLKVYIYNKLNSSFPLVAGTRLGFEGNIFKTLQRVNLPEGSETNPSKVEAEAFPFELKNQNLNIPKGTKLSLVALEGKKMDDGRLWSDYIYAETAEDYKISEKASEVKIVTQDDLTNLRISLEEKIKKDLQSELYLRYPQSYPIFDEFLISFKVSNISHSLGEKTDKLSGLVQGKLETYVLNKKEVEDLAKSITFKSLGEDKNQFIIEKVEVLSLNLLDFDFKKGTMKVSMKAKAYLKPNLNEEILKNMIKGKSLKDLNETLAQIKGVKSINFKIWPYWRDKLPSDPKRIEVSFE
jgi:predicted DNA-binding antitoxin AbrB/MazE fold protein